MVDVKEDVDDDVEVDAEPDAEPDVGDDVEVDAEVDEEAGEEPDVVADVEAGVVADVEDVVVADVEEVVEVVKEVDLGVNPRQTREKTSKSHPSMTYYLKYPLFCFQLKSNNINNNDKINLVQKQKETFIVLICLSLDRSIDRLID